MKNYLLVILIACCSTMATFAQNVGINTTGATPNTSSGLDVDFTNKGLLIPRVALTSITDAVTITTPATSLLVYNTNASITGGQGTGYYYNSGTSASPLWLRLSTSAFNDTLGWTKALTTSTKATKTDDQYVTGKVGVGDFSTVAPSTNIQVVGNGIIGSTTNTVTGTNSLATGNNNTISGGYSLAAGQGNYNGGNNNIISGFNSRIENGFEHSIVVGYTDTAAASATGVFGFGNKVSDFTGFATGDRNKVTAQNAFASGYQNNANGYGSIVAGQNNTAASYSEAVFGANSTNYTPIGAPNAFIAADRIFNVGNGASNIARADAFTILKSGNVGINNSTPDFSAKLDITATNKGLLIPRVSLTSVTDAVTIATPAISLLVYNTNASITGGQGTGYYYNSGTTAAPLWIKLTTANEAWLLKGNSGISSPAVPGTYGTSTIGATENWMGTTDANDVVFGTNFLERMRIKQTTGYVGIGMPNPFTKLNISGGNWDVENGIGDFHVGDGTYRFKLGLATAGAGAGDVRMTSHGGTNRIFIGGGTNSEVITVDGTNQRVGIKNNISPSSVLDIAGDIALKEGTAMTVAAGNNALTLTGEYSHYRLTGAASAFTVNTISGGNDGQYLILINASSQIMTVANNNAANGILTGNGVNLVADGTGNSAVSLIYNATLARWIVVSYAGMRDAYDWHLNGNIAITTPASPATYGTSTIGAAENWIGTTDANDFTIGTNNIERMRIKQSSGNVGIGLAAPTSKLHVHNVADANKTTTYSYASQNATNSDYDNIGVMGLGKGGNATWGYGAGLVGIGDQTNSWYAQGVYAGLGTGTPTLPATDAALYVDANDLGLAAHFREGSVVVDGADQNNGAINYGIIFGTASGEGIGSKRTATGNQYGLDFYQGYANRMRVWNDGNIVIGQSNTASLAPYNSGLGNPNLTISNPSTLSMTSDIPLFTARHYGTSGTTWQMGSIEYYTEGEANIGFTYQICPLNSNTTTNLGSSSNSKYLGYRWNQLFCTVAPNVSSDINLKKDIKAVEYGIHQLRKINPIEYKFKTDYAGTDNPIPDAEKRTHIGFNAQEVKQIIPEIVSAWDYITNNEDGYLKAKTPTLGMVYEEMIPVTVNAIKQLDKQQQQIIKSISISDFGMEQSNTDETRVVFSKEFKDKLQGNPIVTITALIPNASYYIIKVDKDGFVVKNNNSNNLMSFNWMAMAKINEQNLEIPTDYTEEMHQQKLKQIDAFEATLPSNEEALKMIKAKSDAKQQKQSPILTPEQQKAKDDAEKVKTKSKISSNQPTPQQNIQEQQLELKKAQMADPN